MEMMRVLRPGQNRKKQLRKEYGDKLLYVRYHYNYQSCKCNKTIVIVVSEQDWQLTPAHPPIFGIRVKLWAKTGRQYLLCPKCGARHDKFLKCKEFYGKQYSSLFPFVIFVM